MEDDPGINEGLSDYEDVDKTSDTKPEELDEATELAIFEEYETAFEQEEVSTDQSDPNQNRRESILTEDLSDEEAQKRLVRFVDGLSFEGLKREATIKFAEPTLVDDSEPIIARKDTKIKFVEGPVDVKKGKKSFDKEPEGIALKYRSVGIDSMQDVEKNLSGFELKRAAGLHTISLETLSENHDFLIPKREVSGYDLKRSTGVHEIDAMSQSSEMQDPHEEPLDDEDDGEFEISDTSTDQLIRGLLPGMDEDFTEQPYSLPSTPPTHLASLPEVLEADNPNMIRFQNVLKQHLLKQIERLNNQIKDFNYDIKLSNDEAKGEADLVYRQERFVFKQEENIQALKNQISDIIAKREKLEENTKPQLDEHKLLIEEVNKARKKHAELTNERKTIGDIVTKLKEMEAAKSSALKFSMAESHNTEIEKEKMADEKLKQDWLIWNLESEVLRLKKDIEISMDKIVELQNEVRCVENVLNKAEEDLNALEDENKSLRNSIKGKYDMIALKDKDLEKFRQDLQKSKGNLLLMVNTIRSYGLSVDEEIIKNESNLAKMKSKRDECEKLRTELNEIMETKANIERMCDEKMMILQETEISLEKDVKEGKELEKKNSKIRDLQSKQEVITKEKYEEYRGKLKENITTKKMSENIQAMAGELDKINKELDASIIQREHELAKLMVDVESSKYSMNKAQLEVHRIMRELAQMETEMRAVEIQKKKIRNKFINTSTRARVKKEQVQALQEKIKLEGGDSSKNMSPLERKLKALEQQHAEMTQELKNMSDEWLVVQNELLSKRNQRTKLNYEINFIRKHIIAMESCKNKNEALIEATLNDLAKCNKAIEREHKSQERCEAATVNAIAQAEVVKSAITDLQHDFEGVLKQSECETLTLAGTNCEYQESIDKLRHHLAEAQQMLLEWKKKCQLAYEAKERIEKEREDGGEIGMMKQEIHRMEVRYAQLRKAQEKLMVDLEQCVSRRDLIIDNADAREKRARESGKCYSRIQLQRKINEIKSKLQHLSRKKKELLQELANLRATDQELRAEYSSMKTSIDTLKSGLQQLDKQIEEGQVHKHACLETTVLRQQKCKFLEALKFGRYRCNYKTEEAQCMETTKLQSVQVAMAEVTEVLKTHFPHLRLQILQIENSITPGGIKICTEPLASE